MKALRPLALVTGGWRRIGGAIAQRLAADGWDLALHAHHASSMDEAFVAQLASAGASVHGITGDLADSARVGAMIAEVTAAAGHVPTLLVNCASAFHDDTLPTLDADSLELHFRVNLFAPMLLAQAFAAAIGQADAGEGAIVHILDQRVRNPVPDQFSYTLSKQALHASVTTLARALAPRIRVNAVAPGLTLPTDDYDEAQWQRLTALMPLQRLAGAADIADAVAHLAGARAVTGQTLFVDGGASLESYPRDFVYLGR